MRIVPPFGMASRLLHTRLRIAASSCALSSDKVGRPRETSTVNAIASPAGRRSSASHSAIKDQSTASGTRVWPLPKVSNCRVRRALRSAARCAVSMSLATPPSLTRRLMRSRQLATIVNRLLKSWAKPA